MKKLIRIYIDRGYGITILLPNRFRILAIRDSGELV